MIAQAKSREVSKVEEKQSCKITFPERPVSIFWTATFKYDK